MVHRVVRNGDGSRSAMGSHDALWNWDGRRGTFEGGRAASYGEARPAACILVAVSSAARAPLSLWKDVCTASRDSRMPAQISPGGRAVHLPGVDRTSLACEVVACAAKSPRLVASQAKWQWTARSQ